jgi:DNA polymerase-3 subunit delta
MDYASFLKAADSGDVPPVVLLHGPEPLLLEDAVSRVTRGLFPGASDLSLSREIFDAKDAGAERIVQAALMLPWTASRRLVVVKGADAGGAKQGEPLAAYLQAPNPSTVLLLLAAQSLQVSHWLMTLVPRPAIVPAVPPPAGQLTAWVRARARAEGFDLAADAAAMLVDLCGDDLAQLRGEVEKAALTGGPDNREVSVAEVRAVVGEHRLRHIFDLTRALARRDTGVAFALCESLLNAGEDPLAVLAMLAREVRAVWQAAEGLRMGRREDEITRGLQRPPVAAVALVHRARSLPPGAGGRLLARCWEVERRLKLGGAARPELSLLIADLCAV